MAKSSVSPAVGATHFLGLCLMISRPGKNACGAVDLFGDHGAHEHVGPGLGTKSEACWHGVLNRVAIALGATDQKGEGALAIIAPIGDVFCKLYGGPGWTMFVEADDFALAGEFCEETLTFDFQAAA